MQRDSPLNLGELRASNRPRVVVRIVVLALSGLVAAFAAAMIAWLVSVVVHNHEYAWATDTTSLAIEDGFFLVIGAVLAAYGVRMAKTFTRWWPSPTVSLFERGLVYERGARRTVIAWDAVDHLLFEAVRLTLVTIAGDKTGESYRVVLGAGAQSVVLTESISLTPGILAMARQALARNCLPAVLERLRRGETVTFGGESVGPDHVRIGGKTIPWASLRSVDVRNGLVIAHFAPRRRASRWVRAIPNVDVLLAAVELRLRGTFEQ